MPVLYGGKKLIAAPFVALSKVYDTNDDGTPVNSKFQITVTGTILVHKGSPNSSGVFWTASGYPSDEVIDSDSWLTVILRKQEAIRQLFATPGLSFEVQGYDGAAPLKCNPRVKSIEFPAGQTVSWAHRCAYTIVLEADVVYLNGVAISEDGSLLDYKIEKASETWNMEASDEFGRTYKLSHAVSAKGKKFYDETGTLVCEPWQQASGYVLAQIQLGIDTNKINTGVLKTGYDAYNYLRSQSIDEKGGTFGVTETWLCFSGGNAIEEFQVNAKSAGDGYRNTVTVEGTIRGLEIRDNTTYEVITNRYANALTKYNAVYSTMYTRASGTTGIILNTIPLDSTFGSNPIQGTITYNFVYDDRPALGVTGAISEVISVSYDYPTDIFSEIPIIGLADGPVIQGMATVTSSKKNLSIEAVLPASSQTLTQSAPNTNAIVAAATPAGSVVKLTKDSENFSITTGRYSRNVSWTYRV